MLKIIILSILIVSFFGCSNFSGNNESYPFNQLRDTSSEDFLRHIESLLDNYIKRNNKLILPLNSKSNKYIQTIYERIATNNEITFRKLKKTKLIVLKSNKAFFFSVPGNKVILSSHLIKKYLKNESLFVAVFTREILKSQLGLYKKIKMFPNDEITLKELLKITRLDLKDRAELNNISLKLIKRTGYDPEAILLWLQTQNRDSLYFNYQYENTSIISKEEFLLKDHIVSQVRNGYEFYQKNSSKEFYAFIRNINDF